MADQRRSQLQRVPNPGGVSLRLVLVALMELSVVFSGTKANTFNLFVREEAAVNETVANFSNLPIRILSMPIRADMVSNDFDRNFGVRPDGGIFVKSRIDLDEMPPCPEPSSNESICCKSHTIMAGDASQWPKFRLCLVDVNEHVPTFYDGGSQNVRVKTIEQAENEKNQKVVIPLSLKDNDFSSRKQRTFAFFLANNTDSDTRRLFGSHLSSNRPTSVTVGPDSFALKLAHSLDREKRDVYNFTLLACEPTNLTRCGELDVSLIVTDENDNDPQFVQAEYSFNVSEAALESQDYAVGNVNATDADLPENGNTQYEMGEAQCDDPTANSEGVDVSSLFHVDQQGRLTLSGYMSSDTLDYEKCRRVSFLVRARDANRAETRNEDKPATRVLVNILNVDDTAPTIKFEMKDVSITENQRSFSNALPVRIVVTDSDTSMVNVSCYLLPPGDSQFRLQNSESPENDLKEYVLYPTRSLNREEQSEVNIVVECADRTGNRNRSALTVTVLDENDNSPVFDSVTDRNGIVMYLNSNRSEVSIPENNQPRAFVARVRAQDTDAGSNGEIEYALLNDVVASNRSGRFEIDSKTGELFALNVFDREHNDRFELVVAAIDRGVERRTAIASLTVRVTDENDNAPRFTERQYHFRVPEALDGKSDSLPFSYAYSTLIGTLNATDRDSDSQLVFSLLNETSRFFVNERGELHTTMPLDREVTASYWLAVQVSDGKHADTAQVLVELIDLDDSAPEFLFPHRSSHNYTARFECPADRASANREFLVAQLDAVDRDADPAHSQVAYGLISNPVTSHPERIQKEELIRQLFRVDERTGRVWYKRSADCITGTFELHVEAFNPQDPTNVTNKTQSIPSRRADSRLLVIVTQSQSQSQFTYDGNSVSQRNANSNREAFGERETATNGIGMPQLLVALAIGAVVVVIAILVLLVIVARLHHREDQRIIQRSAGCGTASDRKRRRKLLHASDVSIRRGVANESKPPHLDDDPDAEYGEEEEEDDDEIASSARNISGCATPTYSSAQAHARLSASVSQCRRNYVYHPVPVAASRGYQLATLTHNNNDVASTGLTRHPSCGSVCSACAAATVQRAGANTVTDERYHVLLRMADEYEAAADEDDAGDDHQKQTKQPPVCACPDCAILNHRTTPGVKSPGKNEYAQHETAVRYTDDAPRGRYATVSATMSRRDQFRVGPPSCPTPAPNNLSSERIYVHTTSTTRLSNRPVDLMVSLTDSDRLPGAAARCTHEECEDRNCGVSKRLDDIQASPAMTQSTARQPPDGHCAVSFV